MAGECLRGELSHSYSYVWSFKVDYMIPPRRPPTTPRTLPRRPVTRPRTLLKIAMFFHLPFFSVGVISLTSMILMHVQLFITEKEDDKTHKKIVGFVKVN